MCEVEFFWEVLYLRKVRQLFYSGVAGPLLYYQIVNLESVSLLSSDPNF